MTWPDFAGSREARRRYWARATVGFRRFGGVQPNPAHQALALLEQRGEVDGIVTQNVDGLHEAAGSRNVVALHGTLAEVVCLDCGRRRSREELQRELDAANPWLGEVAARVQADGDADLPDEHVGAFELITCVCGGDLRPDVVFFGEHVPRDRMQRARALVEAARTVLVAGSSLTVGSGYLLVRHALRSGAHLTIVNQGPTRADHLVEDRIDVDVTEALPALLPDQLARR